MTERHRRIVLFRISIHALGLFFDCFPLDERLIALVSNLYKIIFDSYIIDRRFDKRNKIVKIMHSQSQLKCHEKFKSLLHIIISNSIVR